MTDGAAPARSLFNPFPGLRPFEPEEDHLFFGRERQTDELLRRLRSERFLAVVGTSGSGKSSLVRCGLIPSLYSGAMVWAGSSWRVTILRPGEDPIGQLASALDAPDALGTSGELADTNRVLLEATLRRSSLGLLEAVRQAHIPPEDNLLVLVDQFEELFRFRRSRESASPKDAGAAFVKLLLEASRQRDIPVYVVLTMRSDFIGDCMTFAGLPEAVTAGQYLMPRMSRDELRSAITGPVAVGGGEIAPRLVARLLNEVGDDPDQLPVLQHALMRTWDRWHRHGESGQPIDIADYEAIGTVREALSRHADEAYEETGSELGKQIAERMFQALTDRSTDRRGVRRPASVAEIAGICQSTEAEVIAVVEVFRRPGRCFLMPPAGTPLAARSIIDISHESLMRVWTRLVAWAEEERVSAEQYFRLARAAAWNQEGTAGLWRDPELEFGLQWRRKHRPTAAWARRYDASFDEAMHFLNRSQCERDLLSAERERERKKKLRQAQWTAGVLATLLVVAVALGLYARAAHETAERYLRRGTKAARDMVELAHRESNMAPGVPEVEEIRTALLRNAAAFSDFFVQQRPERSQVLEAARTHFELAEVYRVLGQTRQAAEEYGTAIEQLKSGPQTPESRKLLADAYNWMGEAERPSHETRGDAERAYQSALELQEKLHREFPRNAAYQQELARTHNNRGILFSGTQRLGQAKAEYAEALRLLEPLASFDAYRQDLARTYINLANADLAGDPGRAGESYRKAVGIYEALVRGHPENRDYKLELARFSGNLAMLLNDLRQPGAGEYERRAAELFHELATIPSIEAEEAYVRTLRGRILQSSGSLDEAEKAYRDAVGIFQRLEQSQAFAEKEEFHLHEGQALFYLGCLLIARGDEKGALPLLNRAVQQHEAAKSNADLAYDYLWLTRIYLSLGSTAEARNALDRLGALLPKVSDGVLEKAYGNLHSKLGAARSGR